MSPGAPFEGEADSDLADVPVGSVEDVELQSLILNGAGAVEFQQVGQRQSLRSERV